MTHFVGGDGELYEPPAWTPHVGVGGDRVMLCRVVGDLHGNSFSKTEMILMLNKSNVFNELERLYVVGNQDSLVGVGELLEV